MVAWGRCSLGANGFEIRTRLAGKRISGGIDELRQRHSLLNPCDVAMFRTSPSLIPMSRSLRLTSHSLGARPNTQTAGSAGGWRAQRGGQGVSLQVQQRASRSSLPVIKG